MPTRVVVTGPDAVAAAAAVSAPGNDLAAALELSGHYSGGRPGEGVDPVPDPPGKWLRLAEALEAGDLARAQKAWDALATGPVVGGPVLGRPVVGGPVLGRPVGVIRPGLLTLRNVLPDESRRQR